MSFLFSCSPLTAEIVKNLALAGVGSISIDMNAHTEDLKGSKLIGQSGDIMAYARSLNPYIKVIRYIVWSCLCSSYNCIPCTQIVGI